MRHVMVSQAIRGASATVGVALNDLKEQMQRSGMRYLRCAVVPLIAWLCWMAVPPLWVSTDSIVILMWPHGLIPHFPFLYSSFVNLVENTVGLSAASLYAMLFFQHAMFVLATTYLAAAFLRTWEAVIIAVFVILGVWLGGYSHAISTEAFDVVFYVLTAGTLVRFWQHGWCTRTVVVFAAAALGLAMTRHISIIIAAVVPLYFLLRSALYRFDRRSSFRHSLVSGVIVFCAPLCTYVMDHLACYAQHNDCTSIVGLAGALRVYHTYQSVPASERPDWLRSKTEGLDPQRAFAFLAMAIERPWDGSVAAISKEYPSANVKQLMNAAFFHFLMTQDRYAFGQMWANLRYATVEPSTTYLSGLADASAYAVHTALGFDAYTKVREALQLDRESQYARLQSFANSFVVQAYDWYLYRLSALLALLLFCVTVLATREATFASVGLAIVGTAVAYLLVCTQITAFLPRYGLPTNFLMNLLSGLSLIQLLNCATERIDAFRLQHAR